MLLAFPLFGRGECPVIAIQSRQQRVIMRRNRKHSVLKRQLCTIVQSCTGENIFLIPFSGSEKRVYHPRLGIIPAHADSFHRTARKQAADLQKQFLCNVVGFVPPLPERLGDDHFGCGELQPPLKRTTCQIIIGKNIDVNTLMNPRILRVVFFNAGRAIAAQLGKMH